MTPKVASSAISAAMRGTGYKHAFPEDAGDEWRFMAVRHPLDRIVSAWAFFTLNEEKIQGQHDMVALGYHYGQKFGDFLSIVLEKHDMNAHTRAQAAFAGPHRIDEVVRLDRLPRAWAELEMRYPVRPLRLLNKSEHADWESYYSCKQRSAAEQVFSADVELFEAA